jgi:hypothetical protein
MNDGERRRRIRVLIQGVLRDAILNELVEAILTLKRGEPLATAPSAEAHRRHQRSAARSPGHRNVPDYAKRDPVSISSVSDSSSSSRLSWLAPAANALVPPTQTAVRRSKRAIRRRIRLVVVSSLP